MKTYIKITEAGDSSGNGFVETLEKAQEVLKQMTETAEENSEAESYTFTTIKMTEEDFDSLPEFGGF